MLNQLREVNTLLNAVTDSALALPRDAGAQYGNEEEALAHAIAVRLGIIERTLGRCGIFAAGVQEALDLDARIQALEKDGITIKAVPSEQGTPVET